MLNSVRASPILTRCFVILFIFGPMLMVVKDDLFSSKKKIPEFISSPLYILYTVIFPNNFTQLVISIVVIYTVRFEEVVISSKRIIIGISSTITIDIITRFAQRLLTTIPVKETGPYSSITFLFLTYLLLFPCVKSASMNANEKILLLIPMIFWTILLGFYSILPFSIGLIVYALMAPQFMLSQKNLKNE